MGLRVNQKMGLTYGFFHKKRAKEKRKNEDKKQKRDREKCLPRSILSVNNDDNICGVPCSLFAFFLSRPRAFEDAIRPIE